MRGDGDAKGFAARGGGISFVPKVHAFPTGPAQSPNIGGAQNKRWASMVGGYGGRELGVVQMDFWLASGGVASRN